jgi:hypothetical protein
MPWYEEGLLENDHGKQVGRYTNRLPFVNTLQVDSWISFGMAIIMSPGFK